MQPGNAPNDIVLIIHVPIIRLIFNKTLANRDMPSHDNWQWINIDLCKNKTSTLQKNQLSKN